MKTILSLFCGLAVLFAGCSTSTQLTSSQKSALVALLQSPSNIQVALMVGGAAVKKYVPSGDVAVIHQFATALLALSSGQLDSTTVASITPKMSATAQEYIGPFISDALKAINLAIVQFGVHNASVLAYTQAVANGLLGAGF
jgi:hypothetical protein